MLIIVQIIETEILLSIGTHLLLSSSVWLSGMLVWQFFSYFTAYFNDRKKQKSACIISLHFF